MPLSAKQMEYLALAWQCFESEPKIDYAKFAAVANLASANSARELMRVTKKKLKEEYGSFSSDQTAAAAPSTPSKRNGTGGSAATPGSKRKKKGGFEDGEVAQSAKKKRKGKDGGEAVVKSEPVEDDGDMAAVALGEGGSEEEASFV